MPHAGLPNLRSHPFVAFTWFWETLIGIKHVDAAIQLILQSVTATFVLSQTTECCLEIAHRGTRLSPHKDSVSRPADPCTAADPVAAPSMRLALGGSSSAG